MQRIAGARRDADRAGASGCGARDDRGGGGRRRRGDSHPRVADANAESIEKVNEAIEAGGESYFRYRQIEMLPQIAPVIASALAQARLITISSDGTSAAGGATNNITSVIQTVLAAQLVSKSGIGEDK